ncbi:hypothetical protein E8E12_000602 [Didymella heteroderae]|uniref:Rhodopsin domain-containing protein n=1 Tax=Didymella heteroderae TaxID=1769908 RepID=A0A9P4WQE1_9PLEO|nr:hypothetical protein E8E12_000602 [Didymella heteroderae]
MGPPLPERLRATTATLGALSIVTTVLRCYVRVKVIKKWGWDDTFIILAFITHMWYTVTLLTGIHYGTGQRTADISVTDLVHAMRCWWLCFLAYASTITFAKLSLGFFFLRLTSIITLHRIATIIITTAAVVIGVTYFFLSLFQCAPVDFFWTRMQGVTGGKCISMEVIIGMTYLYGAIAAATDIGFGLLLGALVWRLKVECKTKVLIAPLLGMACIASYAALVRMPYIGNFKSADFLYGTVDISLWSTVEVGVSVFAANLATLRPLIQHVGEKARSITSRVRGVSVREIQIISSEASKHELRHYDDQKLKISTPKISTRVIALPSEAAAGRQADGESIVSLTGSTRQPEMC